MKSFVSLQRVGWLQHTGFNASVCNGEAVTAPAQEDKRDERASRPIYFNLSAFPAEVVHSSPTVTSFVKQLPAP